jgi:hypothetical protein
MVSSKRSTANVSRVAATRSQPAVASAPIPGSIVVRPRGEFPADVTVEIIRPDDLLALCAASYTVLLDTSGARQPQLVRKTASASARPAIDSSDDKRCRALTALAVRVSRRSGLRASASAFSIREGRHA